jgi:hypothetical protein
MHSNKIRNISVYIMEINIRENRCGNQEWTIQRKLQHWVYKIHDEDKQLITHKEN